eukprot:TRINITY_DN3605_c0_g1_i1.p1 TRINITY_DN3605_c0_g1~~TRINITY_DN3605_c0_g1_i1.p1  ORF type:complete len:147 (+),score=31.81 TRINITY_DN3605_c0_g1_i1:88-528(+)
MSLRDCRMQKELQAFLEDPAAGLTLLDVDDARWVVQIEGFEGLFEGQRFQLAVSLPEGYPFESPEVVFMTPAPEIDHVYSNGHICLNILYDGWSPALTIQNVCLSIQSMVSTAKCKARPEGDEEHCERYQGVSPKLVGWVFDDDTV